MNYLTREDEIKRLERDIQCLHTLINRIVENQLKESIRLDSKISVLNAREELLTSAIVELQDRGVYEQ